MDTSSYDRMNPDFRLLSRIKEYSDITYGKDAYGLSTAEARYILEIIEELNSEIITMRAGEDL
jgi:hypothetical protein